MAKHKRKHNHRKAAKMREDSKSTEQVKDTDAVLAAKDEAASPLNPTPHFAKPESTRAQEEGWKSDAAGAILGEDQKTPKRAAQGNWQTGETNRQTGQPNKERDMMEQAQQTASDVASQVKQATADNVVQAKQAVNETLGQAKQVASETLGQAKQAVAESLSEVKGQMQSTFDEQKTQAVGRLDSVAHVLRQTSEQLNAQHETTFAHYAQAAAEQLENWSGLLQTKNLNELVNEVQDFAHRQPEIFIVGSLAAGLLLGRFLKSSGARTTRDDNHNDYRYRGNNHRRNDYGRGNAGQHVAKHSTQDAIARMADESPAPQPIKVTQGA